MKKILIVISVIISFSFISVAYSNAEEICGCTNKWSGNLRISKVAGDCSWWENEICWGSGGGSQGPEGPQGPPGADGQDGWEGPPGDDGHDGADGKDGTDCPFTLEEFENLVARMEQIEDNILRFTYMYDGTIRDNKTGLIWLRAANEFGYMNWNAAMETAAILSDGEHGLTDGSKDGDWRLPTKEEWEGFLDNSYYKPALCNEKGDGQWHEGHAFTGVITHDESWYWSSTSESGEGLFIWTANMPDAQIFPVENALEAYVWPVRDNN